MALSEQEKIEMQEKVASEIKSIGDNVKKQHEKLATNYKNLETTLNGGRKETDDKIQRLQEDILARQDELDKKFVEAQKKTEEIEVSIKRPGGIAGNKVEQIDPKFVKQFFNSAIAAKGELVNPQRVKNIDYNEDVYREYKNAFDLAVRGVSLSPEQEKALSVGVDTDGGYVVPTEMSNRIIQRVFELDPIRQLANVETISSDSIEISSDNDEFEAGWVNETGTRSETDTAKLGKEKIFAHEMYAQPKATQKFLEDASVDVEGWISRKVGNRFSRLEGAAFVTGDGSEKPRGFLTYDNWTTAGTFEKGKIEQINMGAAAALTADGFVNVKYAMIEDYLDRGTWLMNRSTVAAAMLLKDGVGNYIWKPSMLASDPNSTILGSPVRMATTMPTVASDALAVAYADWSEAYTIVDRLGVTVQRDPYTDKPFILFYTRKRTGGQVVNWQAIKIGKISA